MKVSLVWATPDIDQTIARLARVSNPGNQHNDATAAKLIRYLIRHRHWSPFEMVNVALEVETSRAISRQMLRHWSARFQEFSQRYADVDELGPPEFVTARLQDPQNRQASLPAPPELAAIWQTAQNEVWAMCLAKYRSALAAGIAKEVARAVLPEGITQTRLYMNANMRTWLHFIDNRARSGVQPEHRAVAKACHDVLLTVAPETISAYIMPDFVD